MHFSQLVVGHGPRLLSIERLTRLSPVFTNSSFLLADRNRLHGPLGLRPHQIDRQQPVLYIGAQHLHAVRQNEGTLELARGDAAVEILAALVVLLAPADHQLAFLDADIELIAGEAGDGERDTDTL